MPSRFSDALRNAVANLIVSTAGNGSKFLFYNGLLPATGSKGAVTTQTLLGTLVFPAAIGTVSNGAIDYNETSITQNNALHVTGTPTWMMHVKADGTFIRDISIGTGVGEMIFNNGIVTGQDFTLTSAVDTIGNA